MDIRDIEEARRDTMIAAVEKACAEVSAGRGVQTRLETTNRDAPAACAPAIVEALASVCSANGFPYDRMVSRAYHDTLFMSRVTPVAMLFIPCRNGVSHRPDEYAKPEDIDRGTKVLAETLAELSK